MYRKNTKGWLKHIDFIILDLICLQISFVLAYFIRNGSVHLYDVFLYRNMAIIIELIDLMVLLLFGTLKGVLKGGHYKEFVKTLNHVLIVGLFAVLYLFTIQKGILFSRFVLFLAIAIYLVLTYIVREIWKVHIKNCRSPRYNRDNQEKTAVSSGFRYVEFSRMSVICCK